MKPKDISSRIETAEPADDALPPDTEESPIEAQIVDANAAGEIAQHWYEQENWSRLAAVLIDREQLEAILIHRGCCETAAWWSALERETGIPLQASCQAAWRRWALDESREETGDFAARIVNLLCCAGRYGDFTERLVRIAMRIDAALYGNECSIVGAHLDMLARIHERRGDYAVAEELSSRSVAIAERMDGGASWITSIRLGTLASVLMSREEYGRASKLHRRILAIVEKTDEVDEHDLAVHRGRLASALMLSGNPAAAEPFARRSLEAAEAAGGPGHPLVGSSLRLLADVLEAKEQYAEIVPMRRRALAIAEASVGPDDELTLSDVDALTRLLNHLECFEEAESLLRRTLATAERCAGADGLNVCEALADLASFLSMRDRNDDAEPLFLRIVGFRGELANANADANADVAPAPLLFALQQLGVLCRESGRFGEADSFLQRAWALVEQGDPPDPVHSARLLSSIGQLRVVEKRFDEAEVLFQRCLEIRRATLAPDHPDITFVEERLATMRPIDEVDGELDSVPV